MYRSSLRNLKYIKRSRDCEMKHNKQAKLYKQKHVPKIVHQPLPYKEFNFIYVVPIHNRGYLRALFQIEQVSLYFTETEWQQKTLR